MFFTDIEPPIYGIALAGRAALNLREAAKYHLEGGRIIPMIADTIHKALAIGKDDDELCANKRIETGCLIVEESSMNSVRRMASILRNTDAKRIFFVGDDAQLPPIGAGKPFKDWINSGAVPITALARNYLTDCAGIRLPCDGIRKGDGDALQEQFEECLSAGGVEFEECETALEAETAARIFVETAFTKKRTLRKGVSLHDIAVLTPHKNSDNGVRAINTAIRQALGLPPDKIAEGEILIIAKNNYRAPVLGPPRAEGGANFESKGCGGEDWESIYNGERCLVTYVGADWIEVTFSEDDKGETRRVKLLMRKPGSGYADGQLPEDVEFGYAMSVHKSQGSQFKTVIAPIAKAYKRVGIPASSKNRATRYKPTLKMLKDYEPRRARKLRGEWIPDGDWHSMMDVARSIDDPMLSRLMKS